jgi:hypothetical protein
MFEPPHIDMALRQLRIMLESRGGGQLNDSQMHALRTALSVTPVALIQGPPGTGISADRKSTRLNSSHQI